MEKWRRMAVAACGILLAGTLAALCITGRVTREVVSESGVAYEQKVDSVAYGYQLEQDFVPQYGHLDRVEVHVDASGCARDQGELQVSILDGDGNRVFLGAVPVPELPQYGWVEVPVHVQLTPGEVSTLVLESVGCVDHGPKISFLDSRLAASAEQQGFHLVYAGMDVEHSALQAAFVYAVPIGVHEYLIYYVFGLGLIVFVLSGPVGKERG